MKPIRRQTIAITIIFSGFFVFILAMNERPVAYSDFVNHDPAYFAIIAGACESVLHAYPLEPGTPRVISGTDKVVPAMLKDLRASQIEIFSDPRDRTNAIARVELLLGGKNPYRVAWENNSSDPSLWELAATNEDGRIVLFRTQKISSSLRR